MKWMISLVLREEIDNTVTYSIVQQSGYAGSNGNIDADPLFSDAANGDFSLSSVSSPAVDAGDPSSEYDPDNTVADMGAYPYFQTNGATNTGIAEIISPEPVTSAGINRFEVTFTNFGTDEITSVTIGMKIGDSTYLDYEWTGSLLSGQTSNPVHIGTHSISSGNPEIKIWTDSPNGISDDYTDNDTLSTNIQFNTTPLSGTYIIGPSPSDFEEINHAAQHLLVNGVDGAVIMNIKPGTYEEQVAIENIPGVSDVNTIIFQSLEQDSTSVIHTYTPAGSEDNYTLKFDETGWISF